MSAALQAVTPVLAGGMSAALVLLALQGPLPARAVTAEQLLFLEVF